MYNLNLSPTMHAYAVVFLSALCVYACFIFIRGIISKSKREKEYYILLNFKRTLHLSKSLPEGYMFEKKPELSALDWLIAYYEHKTSEEPKNIFESFLDYCRDKNDDEKYYIRFAAFIYYWDKYRRITNF